MDTFWIWLIKGSGVSVPGYRNVINLYLLPHLMVGILATILIKQDGFTFAAKALFPASSILIGISLAWTTRASAVFQNAELRQKLFNDQRPAEDYVYGFQLAILMVIIMVGYTSVMAGGGLKISVFSYEIDRTISAFFMYFLMSIAIRECWGVVNFSNMLSILDYKNNGDKKNKHN